MKHPPLMPIAFNLLYSNRKRIRTMHVELFTFVLPYFLYWRNKGGGLNFIFHLMGEGLLEGGLNRANTVI